jgi:hypothetical protein
VDIEGVQTVPGQPAIYFPKQGAVMNSILAQLIADVDQRPIVMMWEWRSNGVNRANNAVVFADLDLCQTPVR